MASTLSFGEAENPLVEGLERLPVHPTSLVIFGATGDLAHRKLLPALYNLAHEGQLPERFELIGVGRRDQEHEDFRDTALESIERFSRRKPDAAVLEALLADIRYIQGSFDEDEVYTELGRTLSEFDTQAGRALNRVFYLSTAPEFFPVIAGKLGGGRPEPRRGGRRRIVIEKPIGYDLASARRLRTRRCSRYFDESQVFRIDHYLGKETVQNLMALRFANALFEPVWNRNFIDHVQITASEDIGIGTAPATTSTRARCATSCRTTCCSCWRCSRWSRRRRSRPTACATRRSRCSRRSSRRGSTRSRRDGGPGPVRPGCRLRRPSPVGYRQERASPRTRAPRPTPR
jgi:hypothetical protein